MNGEKRWRRGDLTVTASPVRDRGRAAAAERRAPSDGHSPSHARRTVERSAIAPGGHHIAVRMNPARDPISARDRPRHHVWQTVDYRTGRPTALGQAPATLRQRVFLMTKFDGSRRRPLHADRRFRSNAGRRHHRPMRTRNIRHEDPDRFFSAERAVERCRRRISVCKIRYIVFTGHKAPAGTWHARIADAHDFKSMLPDAANRLTALPSFRAGPAQARQQGIAPSHEVEGRLRAVKVPPSRRRVPAYALGLPPSVVLPAARAWTLYMLRGVRTVRPLSPAQVTAILARPDGPP